MIRADEFCYNRLPKKENIVLDLGCGKGVFLVRIAQRYPEDFFIGIDYSRSVIRTATQKVRKARLENAITVKGDFMNLLDKFPKNSLKKIYVICPDPWFKTRHRKRRTVTYEFMKKAYSLLKENGELHFTTDFEPYMLTVINEQYHKFKNPYPGVPWIHHIENHPFSAYMDKSLDSDGRIYHMRRVKAVSVLDILHFQLTDMVKSH